MFSCYASTVNTYEAKAIIDGKQICWCSVSMHDDTWRITSWYTEPQYAHQGYGTMTLSYCIKQMLAERSIPKQIEYVWNGQNQYVMDWLKEHFDPVCKLPLAVQKYSDADDWDAHIYRLNIDKVLGFVINK